MWTYPQMNSRCRWGTSKRPLKGTEFDTDRLQARFLGPACGLSAVQINDTELREPAERRKP